jgi:hypothetical protein
MSGVTNFSVMQSFHFLHNGGLGWNAAYRAETSEYEFYANAAGVRVNDYPPVPLTLV